MVAAGAGVEGGRPSVPHGWLALSSYVGMVLCVYRNLVLDQSFSHLLKEWRTNHNLPGSAPGESRVRCGLRHLLVVRA